MVMVMVGCLSNLTFVTFLYYTFYMYIITVVIYRQTERLNNLNYNGTLVIHIHITPY
jgi:hypothetical protein